MKRKYSNRNWKSHKSTIFVFVQQYSHWYQTNKVINFETISLNEFPCFVCVLGCVPVELSQLRSIERIDLSANKLTGFVLFLLVVKLIFTLNNNY